MLYFSTKQARRKVKKNINKTDANEKCEHEIENQEVVDVEQK